MAYTPQVLSVPQGGTGDVTLTDNGIICGAGTSPLSPLSTMTNGQLLIGKTGSAPQLATLTEGSNITITNGAGSIIIASSGGGATAAGSIVQAVTVIDNTTTSTGTSLPADDTIPQITEGGEVLTLSITPTSSTNRLIIDAGITASASVVCLFQDSTANCLASMYSNQVSQTRLVYTMISGTTSSTTFRIRIGSAGTTAYYNSASSIASYYDGCLYSYLRITEVRV